MLCGQDWSYVFKPPTVYKYVGSSKYAPLVALPSQLLPSVALPPHAVYRPRWQQDAKRDADADNDADTKRTGNQHPHHSRQSAFLCFYEKALIFNLFVSGTKNSTNSNSSSSSGVKRSASPATEQSGAAAGAKSGVAAGALARAGSEAGAGRGAAAGSPRRSPLVPPPAPAAPPAAAACPLLLNVLLADTVLNVFRDHNFDSCTLCVCDIDDTSVCTLCY